MPYSPLDPSTADAAPATTAGNPLTGNGMTLLELRTELRLLLMGRDDVDNARLNFFINQAYTDMVTSLELEELKSSVNFSLTAGQHLYLIPEDFFATIGSAVLLNAANEEGQPLFKSDLTAYRARHIEDGDPQEYFRHNQMIVVWPTPDAAATLAMDYWIRPVWLTSDTHCPLLKVEWHQGILLKARHIALDALQEWEASMAAENRYLKFVRERMSKRFQEEKGKIVRSSVPRSEAMLRARRGSRRRYD